MTILVMRSVVWAFAREPFQRFPFHAKSVVSSAASSEMTTNAGIPQKSGIPKALWDAFDLCVNLRGIGWSWGPIRNLRPEASQSRANFLCNGAARVVFYAFAVDGATEAVHAIIPATAGRGTILDANLPFPKRHFLAAVAAFIFILRLYSAIELVYSVSSFCCVSVLGQDPMQWPPIFDQPWLSTSLGEFWGKRWHQQFRDCFISLGSRPFIALSERWRSIQGPVGSNKAKGDGEERRPSKNPLPVLGAFFISGVFHDMGCRSLGNKESIRMVGFFMMQAVGVILERALITRRSAPSLRSTCSPGLKTKHILLGRIWVVLWILVWGIPFVDAWAQTGLLAMAIFPEPLKPLRIAQVVWDTTFR